MRLGGLPYAAAIRPTQAKTATAGAPITRRWIPAFAGMTVGGGDDGEGRWGLGDCRRRHHQPTQAITANTGVRRGIDNAAVDSRFRGNDG